MGVGRDSWRILFGREDVYIKGKFGLEETVERFNAVFSPRFFSQHLKHTMDGRLEDDRLTLKYGWHHQHPEYGQGLSLGNAQATLPTPHFTGELDTKSGWAVLTGYVETKWPVRLTALVLIALVSASLLSFIPLLFFGKGEMFVISLTFVFPIPFISLLFLLDILMDRKKRIIALLHWVMTDPLK